MKPIEARICFYTKMCLNESKKRHMKRPATRNERLMMYKQRLHELIDAHKTQIGAVGDSMIY
ncbi:hypothetical protein BTO30_07080 [Domibacillus antri]|uniref:Uncharacterized protein n=1 Tax=Domibacillus antri TaxID=1714264 RepID=A0A1Q8Q6E2_9BACI|nr:hypothetical protein [Domibacillus antri]OLN22900.1 hypothetical protein BTO30_07080 [Domibacillus antri]